MAIHRFGSDGRYFLVLAKFQPRQSHDKGAFVLARLFAHGCFFHKEKTGLCWALGNYCIGERLVNQFVAANNSSAGWYRGIGSMDELEAVAIAEMRLTVFHWWDFFPNKVISPEIRAYPP